MSEVNEIYEHYIFMLNVDSSILKLNPIIHEYGFEIIEVSLDVLEDSFFNLFKGSKFKGKKLSGLWNESPLISQKFVSREFSRVFHESRYKSHSILNQNYVYLIKDSVETSKNEMRIQNFYSQFLQILRLSSDGDVKFQDCFIIDTKSRFINSSSRYTYELPDIRDELYIINDDSLKLIDKWLKVEIPIFPLTDLCKKLYFQSYNQISNDVILVLLITALESIFNISRNKISQTLSKHGALLLAKSKEKSINDYKFLKYMYNFRSEFVHGSTTIKPSKEEIKRLKKTVRDTINEVNNFIIKHNLSNDKKDKQKKDLFDYLNSKGF